MRFYRISDLSLGCSSSPPKVSTKKHPPISDKTSCRLALQRNFLDGSMMHTLACYLQWFLYSLSPQGYDPDDISIPGLPPEETKWLQHTLVQLSRGTNGAVRLSQEALSHRFPVIIKEPNDPVFMFDMIHEYLIAYYGTNHLRYTIPSFCYHYALYHKDFLIRLVMEKIPGTTLSSFARRVIDPKAPPPMLHEFLSILFQTILALEVAQEELWFTHFDLHTNNVMVRETDVPVPYLQFRVLDRIYEFRDVRSVATLIDFGHAVIRHKNGFFGKHGTGSLPNYGMYPFYIPGVDIFKLIMNLWFYFFHGKDMTHSTNGRRLQRFFRHIIEKFFGFSITFDFKTLAEKQFFNATKMKCVFFSPLDLLTFLNATSRTTLPMLGLTSFPFHIRSLRDAKPPPLYQNPDARACFYDLFCTHVQSFPRHQQQKSSTRTVTKEFEFPLPAIETFPLQNMVYSFDNLPRIRQFLSDPRWPGLLSFTEHQLHRLQKGESPDDERFTRHSVVLLFYYRLLFSLTAYESYVHQMYKLQLPKKMHLF